MRGGYPLNGIVRHVFEHPRFFLCRVLDLLTNLHDGLFRVKLFMYLEMYLETRDFRSITNHMNYTSPPPSPSSFRQSHHKPNDRYLTRTKQDQFDPKQSCLKSYYRNKISTYILCTYVCIYPLKHRTEV